MLKLYFKLNTASYTIHHYLNGTTVKVADDQTGVKTIGEELTANKSDALYLAYAAAEVAVYAPSQTIKIAADESKNVITVYYTVPLTITAKDANKTYDGQPLTQPDFKMEGLVNGDTKENFSLSMTAASTITNAGSTPNVINTDTVKYNGGAIPSYYNVSYKPGTLTVHKASATVTITGVNKTHVYDGTQHEAIGYNYSFTGKPNEITISPKPNVLAIARRTDVGTTTMGLTKDSFTVTSANYDVTIKAVIDGYVTITPVTDKVTVTVTENGAIVTYDGNEHSVKGYKSMTADNALYDVTKSVKATETAAWTAKGTNAGEYPVGVAAGDFENTNKNFTNVTFNIVDGVLKINPITENTITITANSASKTYDGTPLTNNGFTFTEGVLADGDVLTAVVEGSATNVGDEGKNVVKSYKVMRGNVDVTGNYTFENSIDGKLTINKRTVTLTSETASKEYDGTPLTKPVVTVGGDGFVAGEVTDVKATGSVTFVHEGEVTNAITYTEGANYKESNYTITKDEGKLSITKRGGEGKTITVTAANGEKVYDGTPLTDNRFDYTEGVLVDGDVLTAVVEGSQTDVGSSDNVVTSYKVTRGNVDVTGNYTFTDSVDGKLTVTARAVTFTGESKSLPYTGGMQSITGITQSGLVEGHRYEGLTYKAEGQNVGSYDGAFSGDVVIKNAQGNDVTKNYKVTPTPGKLTITNASFTVTFTGESDTKVYNGEEQSIIGITATGLLEGHTYSGLSYEAKGKDVGSYDGVFSGEVKIVDAVGKDVTENYAVTKTPGKLTITAVETEVVVTITGHKDTVTYDGKEHPVTGYDVSISNELYKEADFTFTGSAEVKATNASDTAYAMGLKDTDFANKNGNFSNVTFVVTDGSLTINKRTVTLTSETASKEYDGTPLTKPVVTVGGDGFVAGEVTDVKATGSVTFVHEGEVTNAITYTEGANFKGTNYTISKEEGKLSITKREGEGKTITVTAANGEKVYDGAPLTNNDFTHAGALVEGDTLTAVVEGSQTDVGSSDNVVRSYKVMRGETDVTTSYTFADSVKGALTVTLRDVTFTGESKSLLYTGGMQSITGITQSGLVEGHRYEGLTYKAEGQNVGSYDGAFSGDVVIKDAQGNDVTKNYNVTKTPGTLTITKAQFAVTFTGESDTKVYNGSEQSITGITVDALKPGHRYEGLTYAAKGTDKGEYVGAFTGTVKILDENNVDVTENYAVTKTPGKLTITSPDTVIVTISGNKDTVEYDGQKHEVNGYVVKSISNALYTDADFGFAEGAAAHAEGTDAGEYPMNLTKDSFVNRNANFTSVTFVVEDGKLTITRRGLDEENLVKIIAADNTVYYDGQPHGAKLNAAGQIEVNVSYTTEYLAPGHKVQSVVIDGSRTKVGLYKDELVPKSAVIVDKTDKDVTENYEITYVRGTLEIRKNETEIKVTANSHTWEYDGQAHSDGGYTVTYGNESYTVKAGESATLSTGDKVTAVVKGQVKDVDDTKAGNNEIVEWSVEHRDFYNNVTPANGTLTITPRKVTLKSDGGSKKYDGTPLTKPEVTVTGDGFVAGEVSDIKATGSVTYVSQGEVDNLITFTKNEGFKDSNYEIEERIGKLSIEALDVTIIITGPSAIREYKPGVTHTIVTGGSELDFVYGSDKVDGKIGVEGMVEGDKILPGTLKHTLEGMYVGEYEGVFTLFDSNGKKADKPTVMHDGVDVTENYKFSYNPGKLTITGKHMDGGKEVENEAPEKNYLLGQKIPFTITVRSVSKDELKDVTVTDPTATILPDRNTANPAYTVSEDEHTATITSLAPEAEVIVYAEHEVTEDDIINRYTNEATINWGNDEVKVSKTPSIEEENPEAELVKEIVLQDGQDENHKFKLGETVYFKITVTNTGNVTLNEYEVKEVLPGAAFIDGTGYTLNNDKTVATIEKMEPVKDGQEAPDSNQIVLYAQYNIKEEDLGNKELKNIVTADNSKPGEVPIPVDEAKSVSGQKIWKDEGNAFNTRPASITLTLMRKLGQNGAAEQYRTMQLGSNDSWRYSFDHLPKHDAQENEYFYWVVEEPVTGYDTAYETKDESHCDIVNNLQTYTLTIHYWQHKLGDTKMEQAFPDYVATLYYKQPYDVESPEREGIILDDMSQARISGTMPAHDLVIDVYYHRIAYRLTIHYIYQDGAMAHEDYTWTYWFNSTYNVPSPIIPGFTPSIDVIAGRMPSHGLELTVVYVGDGEIVIPDEDTSLGFKSYLNAGECFE